MAGAVASGGARSAGGAEDRAIHEASPRPHRRRSLPSPSLTPSLPSRVRGHRASARAAADMRLSGPGPATQRRRRRMQEEEEHGGRKMEEQRRASSSRALAARGSLDASSSRLMQSTAASRAQMRIPWGGARGVWAARRAWQ